MTVKTKKRPVLVIPPERKLCQIDLLKCMDCGRMAVAINDLRVTSHKCSGAWDVVSSCKAVEEYVLDALKQPLPESVPPVKDKVPRKCRVRTL